MTLPVGDEMEVLAPASASVTLCGEVIEIARLPVGVIPLVVRELRPIIAALRGDSGDVLELDITPELLMDLIVDHSEALFTAVSLCADRPVDHIKSSDPAEFIGVALKVVEVNRDFFTQKIAPLLGGLLQRFRGAGPTPSSS